MAALIGVNRETVYRLARRGLLRSFLIGRLRRFLRADIKAFLARCVREAPSGDGMGR